MRRSARGSYLAALGVGSALLSSVVVGCLVSTSGLTRGGDASVSDASTDRVLVADAADAGDTTAPTDAPTPVDVLAPADAPSDGLVPPTDAAVRDSGAARDTSPVDAGCVPVSFDAGIPVACPTPTTDASCYAQPEPSFTASFVPPRAPINACTSTQISTFIQDCLGTTNASSACTTFQMDSTNAACLSCLVSPFETSESEFGPLLQGMNYVRLNIGGCILLTEPCQMACAAIWEAKQECELAACGSGCPVTNATTGAAYESCIATADTCSCLPEATAASNCQTALAGTAAAQCFPILTFNDTVAVMGALFCGGS